MWETEARLVLLLDYFSIEKGNSHGRGEDQSLLSLDCPMGDISHGQPRAENTDRMILTSDCRGEWLKMYITLVRWLRGELATKPENPSFILGIHRVEAGTNSHKSSDLPIAQHTL